MSDSSTIVESHLTRADSLCRQWSTLQNRTCSLLSSLSNILAQRHETLIFARGLEFQTNPVLMGSNLDKLIYKQTRAIEEMLSEIQETIPKFRNITEDLKKLFEDSSKHVIYTFSANSSHKNDNPATISPYQSHTWIEQLVCMYSDECDYKRTLLANLQRQITPELAESVNRRWAAQRKIQFEIEEEMVERLRLVKRIREAMQQRD